MVLARLIRIMVHRCSKVHEVVKPVMGQTILVFMVRVASVVAAVDAKQEVYFIKYIFQFMPISI